MTVLGWSSSYDNFPHVRKQCQVFSETYDIFAIAIDSPILIKQLAIDLRLQDAFNSGYSLIRRSHQEELGRVYLLLLP